MSPPELEFIAFMSLLNRMCIARWVTKERGHLVMEATSLSSFSFFWKRVFAGCPDKALN
jgi:hypothetical protein